MVFKLQVLSIHFDAQGSMPIVSHTSNVHQHDVGNYFGLYTKARAVGSQCLEQTWEGKSA